MVDGQVFQADGPIQPGWVLVMPDDADNRPALQLDTTTGTSGRTVTVHRGDTLSSIAEDELGSANDYPQLFAANQGRAEPGGARLTDPDLIRPGWELSVPGTGSAAGPSEGHHQSIGRQEGRDHGQHQQAGASTTERSGHGADQPAHPTVPGTTASPPSATAAPKPTPTASPQPSKSSPAALNHDRAGAAPNAPEAGTTDDTDSRSIIYMAAAATSLAAAALLAVVGARRAVQQRRRRPRRRIPLPRPATPTADLEKHLRVASDPVGLDLADQALRTLAANCAASGRALPPLAAVRVTARGLQLHLSAPTPTVAPFIEQDDQPDLWWCPARGAALLSADEVRDITAPYPALVSVGTTAEQEPVLVNLESVGLLRLAGSAEDVRAVMLGLAVELASSGLSDDTTVILAGLGAELAGVFPVRVEHQMDLAHALPELRAHDALQRGALTAGGLDSLDQARLAEDGGDTWVPKVLITPSSPDGEDADALTDLLSSRPRTATAIVTEAGGELDVPGAWTLPAAPGTAVQLPGLDLAVTLQRLDGEAYEPLIQLLATASRTDDVAAPAWTHAPDGTALQNGPASVTARGDSALAQDAPEVEAVNDDLHEEDGEQPPDEPPAAPAVQVAASPVRSSLITAVPSSSALAPQVTGAQDGLSGDNGPDQQHGEGDDDELDAGQEPLPESLFDQTLREVLDERGAPAATDEYGQEEEPAEEAADMIELATEQPEEEGSALSPAILVNAPRPQLAPELADRPAGRVTAVTSGVLAALNTPPDPPSAPQVRVLGPVDVIGTLGKVESNRRNGLTEIAAWLALHPGKSRHELDEAIWPGQRVRADTRNTNISKLRAWLGRDPLLPPEDPYGAYLPPISEGVYAFNDQVTSDWQQFQAYYQEGMHSSGADADTALANALSLVRGRPFSGIDQSKYAWAEYDIQEMISATTDVAHELATRRLAVRDYRAALAAASRGLVCDQMSELLYRDLFTIYSETGDRKGLERTARQLTRIAVESGCDSSPETVALINALMDANRIASA
jgi:LysM repeat protein